MKLISLLFIPFVFLSSGVAYSQADSLILFTKANCSNCISTKELFLKESISYKEYKLEKSENAKIMLDRLAKIGYTGKIVLPVIFLNSEIYHPAILSDTVLKNISLYTAVKNIISLNKNDKIELIDYNLLTAQNDSSDNLFEYSDCEIEINPTYLICKNFKSEHEALDFVGILKKNGYSESGYLNYKRYYRVYYKIVYSKSAADAELEFIRKRYPESYLLSI